jgi:hypothetical protein
MLRFIGKENRMKPLNFLQCYWATLRASFTNLASFSFFCFAILFYSFYYPLPYLNQFPEHIRTAVVDLDNSSFSRKFIQELRTVPQLDVVTVTGNPAEADKLLAGLDVHSIITIPVSFDKDRLRQQPAQIAMVADGSFLVAARFSLKGIQGPLSQAYKQAVASELLQAGTPLSRLAQSSLQAPAIVVQNMYNTIGGYLNFVVPLVFNIIFQTAFLVGIGFLINDWCCSDKIPRQFIQALTSQKGYLAMLLAFMTPIFGWMLFIQGFTFWRTETNTLLDFSASTVTALVYSAAIASLGIFIAVMMGKCRLVAQFVVCSSLTLLFISGDLFAYQNIPAWARWLSQISPSTPGIHAMVRASQAGASVSQIWPYILHLLLLTAVFIFLTRLRARAMQRSAVNSGTVISP